MPKDTFDSKFTMQVDDRGRAYTLLSLAEDLETMELFLSSDELQQSVMSMKEDKRSAIQYQIHDLKDEVARLKNKLNSIIDAHIILMNYSSQEIKQLTTNPDSPYYDPHNPDGLPYEFYSKFVMYPLKDLKRDIGGISPDEMKENSARPRGLALKTGRLWSALWNGLGKKNQKPVDYLDKLYNQLLLTDTPLYKTLIKATKKSEHVLTIISGPRVVSFNAVLKRKLQNTYNGVSPDKFEPIYQGKDVIGAGDGNCYGYVRLESEQRLAEQGHEGMQLESTHQYQAPESLGEVGGYIETERARMALVYHRQESQFSEKASHFNQAHNKRLTRAYFMGTGARQQQSLFTQKIIEQASSHVGQPLHLRVGGPKGGHALQFTLSKDGNGDNVVSFTDPNSGTFTFKDTPNKKAIDKFKQWFEGKGGYCSDHLSDYDMFQIHCYKKQERNMLGQSKHRSVSGKLRSLLTGARYNGVVKPGGLLATIHRFKRFKDQLAAKKEGKEEARIETPTQRH